VGQDGEVPTIFESSRNSPGAGSADYLPQNCALLVKKQTNRGGRRGRGRFYVPMILPEASVDPVGNISGPQIEQKQTAADGFLEQLSTGPLNTPMVLLHNTEGVSTAGAPDPVTKLTVDGVISTQRRRLR
jgi:hypothetical protein